jgi:nucleoside-diphosphate-sugar epimerase
MTHIVVIGATGNVGTSVLASLAADDRVEAIVAVARRLPDHSDWPRTKFVRADITGDPIEPILHGADAVIHLAWLIQPGRAERVTHAVNVDGSRRVFEAAVRAGVPAIVYASSLGAYSPGPKDRLVDESWPTAGIPTSFYSRHKVEVEVMLDRLEQEQPQIRVVRMRPALIFKREAATEIRRLFLGPLFPGWLVQRRLIPVIPDMARLRFQVVHSHDVGDAYRLAALGDGRGAFNLAADPPLGGRELASLFDARRVRIPPAVARAAAKATFAARLQPTEPGWLDMGLGTPLIDPTRARTELGWRPRHDALETMRELLDGLRGGADLDTPPLARETTAPARSRELLTGVGARQ